LSRITQLQGWSTILLYVCVLDTIYGLDTKKIAVGNFKNYSAARLICTILLYVCVLDTIYGLVTKKIAVGNLRKIIVTPKSSYDTIQIFLCQKLFYLNYDHKLVIYATLSCVIQVLDREYDTFWNSDLQYHCMYLQSWECDISPQNENFNFNTGPNQILDFIFIYKCTCIYLNKNWNIYWSWVGGPVVDHDLR
jgi:hypothetical protein